MTEIITDICIFVAASVLAVGITWGAYALAFSF